MTEDPDEFRMGFMLDHDHTMKILMLAAKDNYTPQETLYELIDKEWI